MVTLAHDAMLGDRYRLDTRIAIGGMGEVWRAHDILLDRLVAVKVLKDELSADQGFLNRFRNEARSAASFSHAGIAGVYDYGETPTGEADRMTAYLVMELVDGEPLSAILARVGRLHLDLALDYVGQAATALQVAHRSGMVHRDIKPGNLLVTPEGQVKITDFGIARAASTVPLTQVGMVVGTAQYFSPEQAEGQPVGPASDVYSLGVVAFECLTGHLPFVADSPITVAMMQIRNVPPPLPPDIPPPVRGVVERAMAKHAPFRYADGGQLATAIAAAREGRFDPIPPPAPIGSPEPALPPMPTGPIAAPLATGPIAMPMHRPRRSVLLIASVVLVLAAIGVTIWILVHRGDTRAGTGTPSGSAPLSVPARRHPTRGPEADLAWRTRDNSLSDRMSKNSGWTPVQPPTNQGDR
ncbi:MAG TPA: protein kinase [Mycobacteriales bacterium]|nr:protein kinase [Mycobacteriales bacterium]